MIDSGAKVNIIKESALRDTTLVNKSHILRLRGIASVLVSTKGSVQIQLLGRTMQFHVVSCDFPITQTGILGAPFLNQESCIVDYENRRICSHKVYIPFDEYELVTIQPRSSTPFHIRIANPEIKTGHVPRLKIKEGIFLGDAVVTNDAGRAYLPVFNTTDIEFDLVVPTVELESYDIPSNTHSECLDVTAIREPDGEPASHASTDRVQEHFKKRMGEHIPSNTNTKCLAVTAIREPDGEQASHASTDRVHKYSERQENENKGYAPGHMSGPHRGDGPDCTTITAFREPDERETSRATIVKGLLRLTHLNGAEKENVEKLIEEAADRFHLPNETLGATTFAKHTIHTTDDVPISTKQYRFPPIHKEEINKQIEALLQNGTVTPSNSPYNSPLWIVPKKPDSQGNKRWRMVIDYRKLNEKTIGDAYPLPNINEILDQLGGAKYFSVFDLASGFHQIPMSEKDAQKTAFSTPHGHYQFERMPFGLKNAPATFQRLMDNVLTGLQGQELFVYLDDIVIYAKSLHEHEVKFRRLIERLRHANLKLQPDKCEFLRREVNYLGHIIGEDGVKPDPGKITAVERFPTPRNVKTIRQFLGLAGYYRRFIPNFSKVSKPLTDLLKKEKEFKWEVKQKSAFDQLKGALCSEPILQYPDFTQTFNLTTDASGYAIGGVLSQGPIGKDLPIGYASRLLNGAEQRYSTIEKECLAIIYCVSHFRPYLYGRKFLIITDHKPLVWLHSIKDPSSRLWKWRLKLSEYNYEIEYKAGSANANADALSRNPPASEELRVNTEIDATRQHEEANILTFKRKRSSKPLHERMQLASSSDSSSDEPETQRPRTVREDAIRNNAERIETQQREELLTTDTSFELPISQPRPQTSREAQDLNPPAGKSELQTATQLSAPSVSDGTTPSTDDRIEPHKPIDLEGSFGYNSETDMSICSEDALCDTESINESNFFEDPASPPAQPREHENQTRITETRDSITTRKDHSVVFIDMQGKPVDNGAKLLQDSTGLPIYTDLAFAKAKVTTIGGRTLISLPIKANERDSVEPETLENAFKSLLDVIIELRIRNICIASTPNIETIPWSTIKRILLAVLDSYGVTITVCKNLIKIPDTNDRKAIIIENHCSAIGGHKGVTKTYLRIRQNYAWPNLKRDVQTYVRQCRECQLKKLTRVKTKQPMVITDTPGAAFDKVAIDIVGTLPTTIDGNRYILTMQDQLTKYSIAVPLTSIQSTDIADALTKHLICRFGAPRAILTDQGSSFMSPVMACIARKFRIQRIRTTAYHPQSNGSLERSHHVLAEYLKQYISEYSDWDKWTELAMFSYNTSVHEGTGYTPHELVFGRRARFPSCHPIVEEEIDVTYKEYLETLFTNVYNIQSLARENLVRAKERSKTYYDRHINPQNFKVGDQVYLLKEPARGKFADQYTGPHTVLEILDRNNAKIQYKGRTRLVHINKLKTRKAN